MSKSEWAIKLEGCNFEMARDEIAQMFAIAQEDAKRQGGEVLIHPELHNVLMLFLSNPCLETSVDLLECAPMFLSYFEACGPNGSFSLYARILGGSNDDR